MKKSSRMLIIVESPNKVLTIKNILKGTEYEKAIVKASVGHISKIEDKKGSYHNTGIYPKEDFKISYVIDADKKDLVKQLKDEAELADIVFLATDPDREGEAIAWSLKKFLKIPSTKCKRITFHEITKKAILAALDNPTTLNNNLIDAAQARACVDKMLGYRLSPLARRNLGAKSVGRCQSAGLKLIVDREKEIQDFIPEKYADLFLNFNKNNTIFKAKYFGENGKEIKRPSEDFCNEVINSCKTNCDKGNWFIVKDIIKKDKINNPKAPFTTSTFQQEVSNKLHIGIKQSMNIAQKLFEGIEINGQHLALITYIRTDNPTFADDFLPILEQYVKSNYGKEYYSPIRKTKKAENSQNGHEAIRPVDLDMTPEKLSNYITDKYLLKVYEIIYKRTIATMMASSITSETTYNIVNGSHEFHLVSKELVFDGFLKVYNYKENDEEDLININFNKDEIINKDYSPNLELVAKQTQPPARYKESTFVKELESTGIGRPSTFATILATITDKYRNYCTVENDCLIPTQKGMDLIKFLDSSYSNLININYTNNLEKDLDLIAMGKVERNAFLNEFYVNVENTISQAKPLKIESEKPKVLSDKICPKCGSKMYLRSSAFGEFYGCSKFPYCRGTLKKEDSSSQN